MQVYDTCVLDKHITSGVYGHRGIIPAYRGIIPAYRGIIPAYRGVNAHKKTQENFSFSWVDPRLVAQSSWVTLMIAQIFGLSSW
jgi:hypothetical protein